jgi:hypothetical protein
MGDVLSSKDLIMRDADNFKDSFVHAVKQKETLKKEAVNGRCKLYNA